jgi:hypothetical protein
VPSLVGRHFPERIPPTERKSRRTRGAWSDIRTITGRRQCFGVLVVRPVCVLRAASRLATRSSSFKVKSI